MHNPSAMYSDEKLIVEHFLKEFTLTESESALLLNPSSPIDIDFFNALERLQSIRKNSKALLVIPDHKTG